MENGAGRDVAREVNMLAIRRKYGLAQFLLMLLIGAFDQQDASTAGDMIEPYLAGSQRATRGKMLLRGDEAAIRAPARLVKQAEILFAHLPFVGTVAVHDPDIVAATTVRGKGNPRTIRRKAGLCFKGQAFGYARRRAASYWNNVDITKQVECDRAAIWADVKVHPRTLIGVDVYLAHRQARRRGDIPFGRFIIRRSLRKNRSRHDRGAHQQNGFKIIFHGLAPLPFSYVFRLTCLAGDRKHVSPVR